MSTHTLILHFHISDMSLSEFIAATQADMKSRIEDECRKHMLSLLEDSFSKKWEEYTSKAVENTYAKSVYTEGYGKLDIDSLPETPYFKNEDKVVLKRLEKMYMISSKQIYFVHCCMKKYIKNGNDVRVDCYFIDNYGFQYTTRSGELSYPDKTQTIDITKPNTETRQPYLYPLTNSLIDKIKTERYAISPLKETGGIHNGNTHGYGYITPVITEPGENYTLNSILPHIREIAALQYDNTIIINALKKENEILRARIQTIENKSPPNEDLLGIELSAASTTPEVE
jgi:hypothetical protein